MYYIYQIENLNSGLIYIGCTKNYIKRVKAHKHELTMRNHNNPRLQSDYNNGEKFRYSVLKTADYKNVALRIEKELITIKGHYNIQIGSINVKSEARKDISKYIEYNDDWEFSCIDKPFDQIRFSLIDYSIDMDRNIIALY